MKLSALFLIRGTLSTRAVATNPFEAFSSESWPSSLRFFQHLNMLTVCRFVGAVVWFGRNIALPSHDPALRLRPLPSVSSMLRSERPTNSWSTKGPITGLG